MSHLVFLAQLSGVSGGGGLSGLLGGPPPAPLPAGPVWERWLFEEPLWPGLALAMVGVAAFVVLNQSGQARRGIVAAGVLLAAAAGIFAIAAAVTTDRERLRGATGSLVAAVAHADAAAVGEHLASDVRLRAPVLGRNGMDRDQILAFVSSEMTGLYKVENYRVLQTQATLDGPDMGRTHTHVRVTPDRTGGFVFSWWRLDWRRDADGCWRVTHIEPLTVEDR